MKNQIKSVRFSKEKQYFFATIVLLIFILILYNLQDFIGYETVSLILLLILFLLPLFNFDKGPIVLSAVISAMAWDYYFIPPHFTMHIAKTEDGMMLFMFFVVAVTNGVLTSKLNTQKNEMALKEKRSEALFRIIKDLSSAKDLDGIFKTAAVHIKTDFGFETVIYFPENESKLRREPHPASNFLPDEMEWLAAETAFKSKTEAGRATDIVQGASALYLPLIFNNTVFCVLGIKINGTPESVPGEKDFLKRYLKEIYPFLEKYLLYSNP